MEKDNQNLPPAPRGSAPSGTGPAPGDNEPTAFNYRRKRPGTLPRAGTTPPTLPPSAIRETPRQPLPCLKATNLDEPDPDETPGPPRTPALPAFLQKALQG